MTTARYLIYGRPTSSNVMKVLVVAEECGVDVEIEHASGWLAPGSNLYPVGFGEGEGGVGGAGGRPAPSWHVHSDAYRRMNPNPTVPTLVLPDDVGGGAIWESNTIARYLARKHKPELIGGGSLEKQAAIEKWMDWQLCLGYNDDLNALHDNVVRLQENERNVGVLVDAATRVAQRLSILEQHLSANKFVASDSFTLADIGLGGAVARLKVSMERAVELYGVDFSSVPKLPNIDSWFERLVARPSFFNGCLTPGTR